MSRFFAVKVSCFATKRQNRLSNERINTDLIEYSRLNDVSVQPLHCCDKHIYFQHVIFFFKAAAACFIIELQKMCIR